MCRVQIKIIVMVKESKLEAACNIRRTWDCKSSYWQTQQDVLIAKAQSTGGIL